jgi:hypothetical protein
MATEAFLVTALPYSAAPDESFHVSLFVTHRLTPDGAVGALGEFPAVRDWTAHLQDAQITLRGGAAGGAEFDIPVMPRLDALDPTLWPRVFPAELPVRPWQVPNHTDVPWRSFPAHRMQQHALLVHGASIFSSPVNSPSVKGNALTQPLLQALGLDARELRLTRVIDGLHDKGITEKLDDLTDRGGLIGRGRGTGMLPLIADVHRARRFYQREEDETAYAERPTPGAVAAPVRKPDPDFHERAAMLGDLSPLLRKLGLVIDLRVADVARLASAVWIQGSIVTRRSNNPVTRQPRTACRAVGHTFTAQSASGDYELGMLKLADEGRFTVLDLDPDASALKLEQYVRTMPRLAAAENNGDAVTSAPSTLRATGFAVARADRAEQLHARVDNAAAKDAAVMAGTAPLLTLEQINRGLRLEVWDDVSEQWHSLHRRLLTVSVEGGGEVLTRVPDTGFLQGASVTQSDTAAGAPKYAHEVLAGWDGWSLSVPRPGKVVVHKDGEEQLHDAPPADPNPVNPVASTTEIAPGTLPRLRYGRKYALRAYAVDLAGNSRPHVVAGIPSERGATDSPPVVMAERDATLHATRRIAMIDSDATRVAGRADTRTREGENASDAVHRAVRELNVGTVAGPSAERDATGLNPAGESYTQVPELDRLVSARLNERAGHFATAAQSRSRRIEQLFRESASTVSSIMTRIDVQTDARVAGSALASMLAQQPGLGAAVRGRAAASLADLLTMTTDLVTTPRPFLRWDPVIEPVTVPRFAFTEGESLLRLVIRSGVVQDAPGDLDVTITDPADYAAAVLAEHASLGLAWREDSQRHLAAPKTSQFEAELHGAFDTAMGTAPTAAAVKAAFGIALREAGSFVDVTIADIANPGQRIAQPGVQFHMSPTADAPAVADPADLPDGDPLSAGQYVAHDVDELRLPYLPDPLAAGVSFTFPDAGKDHRLTGLLAVEGITLRYLGTWPERTPFRLVLESGNELGAVVEDHVVRISVPPGEQLRMRMSSALTRASLDLFGLWRSLPQVVRDNPVLREAAADGWFWWLTPATELRLVHAVPRPVEVPRPTLLIPKRTAGDTAVVLAGAVDVHGPSTDRIDIEASWTQWVDDVSKDGPEQVDGKAAACGTSVSYDEDLVVLASDDATMPLPDGSTLRVHKAVHQTGDTQHRMIDYRVRATTRYREHFLPQVTPDIDDLSVVGPVRRLNVPSSARPPKVVVRDVIPLFRWHEETEPSQPFALRRTRRAGVRIYLDRPWYATGDGELLAVLLAAGADDNVRGSVSQWGADPVWRAQGPAKRAQLPLVDLMHVVGLDDRIEAARPAMRPALHTLVDVKDNPPVWVLGYQPEYSPDRKLWFVDVALDPGVTFWPFVQLAVARYQPNSLDGLHLGPVMMCDYVQLTPERMATLSRTDERHARVVVTGTVGAPRIDRAQVVVPPDFISQVNATRTMRARVERYDSTVGTDLGWETVTQHDLPVLGSEGTVFSWAGELPLPEPVAPRTPGDGNEYRVTLEEWEWLPADTGAGGTGGLQPRIVYAEHLLI